MDDTQNFTSANNFDLSSCPIGKEVDYPNIYNPELLFPIPRQWTREQNFSYRLKNGAVSALANLPTFQGIDLWNGYEFSWIDTGLTPHKARNMALIQIEIDAQSEFLIESKSLKLYLYSLHKVEATDDEIREMIQRDLSSITKSAVKVKLYPFLGEGGGKSLKSAPDLHLDLISLDSMAVSCETYQVDRTLLQKKETAENKHIQETFWFDGFRSNCLVTGKPDWASVLIHYEGPSIDHTSLIRYLVSFRNHQGIHEQCMERVLVDLYETFNPSTCLVIGHFTRRGGLDINPIRAFGLTDKIDPLKFWHRSFRQ